MSIIPENPGAAWGLPVEDQRLQNVIGVHVGVQVEVCSGQSNAIRCRNYEDSEGNPTGGYAHGPGMVITWQDGPRGKDDKGELLDENGAFVEDALVAAYQRLLYFQQSKYACRENEVAMRHIRRAIGELHQRAMDRNKRGVLGANVV